MGLKTESNLFVWNVCFNGPPNSLYESGFYRAELSFPTEYPNLPPTMKFLSEMWHPNSTRLSKG